MTIKTMKNTLLTTVVALLIFSLFPGQTTSLAEEGGEIILSSSSADACLLESRTTPWKKGIGTGMGGSYYYFLSDAVSIPPTATATWTPDIPQEGEYKVYVHWSANVDRYSYTSFTIMDYSL